MHTVARGVWWIASKSTKQQVLGSNLALCVFFLPNLDRGKHYDTVPSYYARCKCKACTGLGTVVAVVFDDPRDLRSLLRAGKVQAMNGTIKKSHVRS